jgi:preprotein translocase subunit Sec61beta
MTDPGSEPRPNPRVRDRDVVIAAALVVAGVLIVAWLTGLIPALDAAIGLEPLVIVGLVVMTVLVLARALWPRRPC